MISATDNLRPPASSPASSRRRRREGVPMDGFGSVGGAGFAGWTAVTPAAGAAGPLEVPAFATDAGEVASAAPAVGRGVTPVESMASDRTSGEVAARAAGEVAAA